MFTQTPHLVVVREANPKDGTNLHEFWMLNDAWWSEASDYNDPVVRLYVAPWQGNRDANGNGLPFKDDRATDQCSWEEVPEEVKQEFREEARRIASAVSSFGE